MKYLLEIAYDGTIYKGWQAQHNQKTIQQTIEQNLQIILKEKISIFAAGRTDAGVHAAQQYAHFESNKTINTNKTQYSLNALLKNETIAILSLQKVPETFHARFSCTMKEYQYQILTGNIRNVFLNNRYWLVPKFDINQAQECSNFLLGEHDFSSFRDSQCQAKSPIRSIHKCEFSQNHNLITMKIQAKSFIHHQIRIIIGTIFEIISRKHPSYSVLEILNKKDRKYAGITAPAKGLILNQVIYDNIA